MKYLIHTAFLALTAYVSYRILKTAFDEPEPEYTPADYASALYMDAEGVHGYELPEDAVDPDVMPF